MKTNRTVVLKATYTWNHENVAIENWPFQNGSEVKTMSMVVAKRAADMACTAVFVGSASRSQRMKIVSNTGTWRINKPWWNTCATPRHAPLVVANIIFEGRNIQRRRNNVTSNTKVNSIKW
jgi:hypothetical protein